MGSKKNNIYVFIAGQDEPTTKFFDNVNQLCASVFTELLDADWYIGRDAKYHIEDLLEPLKSKDINEFTFRLMAQYERYWEESKNWMTWGYVDEEPNEFNREVLEIKNVNQIKKTLNNIELVEEDDEEQ